VFVNVSRGGTGVELVELRTVASVPSVSSCVRLGKGVYNEKNWAFRYEIFKD
jgi:hypothetical protein